MQDPIFVGCATLYSRANQHDAKHATIRYTHILSLPRRISYYPHSSQWSRPQTTMHVSYGRVCLYLDIHGCGNLNSCRRMLGGGLWYEVKVGERMIRHSKAASQTSSVIAAPLRPAPNAKLLTQSRSPQQYRLLFPMNCAAATQSVSSVSNKE